MLHVNRMGLYNLGINLLYICTYIYIYIYIYIKQMSLSHPPSPSLVFYIM